MAKSHRQSPVDNALEQRACPFLHDLPLEIREIIYKYTLMERVEHDMKSHQVRNCHLPPLRFGGLTST